MTQQYPKDCRQLGLLQCDTVLIMQIEIALSHALLVNGAIKNDAYRFSRPLRTLKGIIIYYLNNVTSVDVNYSAQLRNYVTKRFVNRRSVE